MHKKVLYLDMDGVLADMHTAMASGGNKHDRGFYANLKPLPGAVEAFHELAKWYDVYIASTPSWINPHSWGEKREWVEGYLGEAAFKRLILTHNKSLLKGDYLIDDNTWNGAGEFEGELIHFGTEKFPGFDSVLAYLLPIEIEGVRYPNWDAVPEHLISANSKHPDAVSIESTEPKTLSAGGDLSPEIDKTDDNNNTETQKQMAPIENSYEQKLEELRELIRLSLEYCDPIESPAVCDMKSTPEGYKKLEEDILDRAIKGGFTVSQAIIQIEKEYNNNRIDD